MFNRRSGWSHDGSSVNKGGVVSHGSAMLTVLLRPSEKRMRMRVECARECVSTRMSAMHRPRSKKEDAHSSLG